MSEGPAVSQKYKVHQNAAKKKISISFSQRGLARMFPRAPLWLWTALQFSSIRFIFVTVSSVRAFSCSVNATISGGVSAWEPGHL